MQDWLWLARSITDRRIELGLSSRAALARKAGVATRTVDGLERGERGYVQPKTVARLETALEWPSGAFGNLLARKSPDGAAPVPAPSPTTERAVSTLLDDIVRVRRAFGDEVARAFIEGAFARPVESGPASGSIEDDSEETG